MTTEQSLAQILALLQRLDQHLVAIRTQLYETRTHSDLRPQPNVNPKIS
jgi:hypothetical protein